MPFRPHRFLGALSLGAALASAVVALPTALPAGATQHASGTPNLSGVTLDVADQFKEYETVFAATGDLKGAPYKVDWSQFTNGPQIIAAETGGSVDLGDMAETPTILAQAAGDPVKVVAATVGANPKASPFALLVPTGSSITKVSQLRGKTIAVQEGTVEQYFLIQILKKAGVPYNAVTIDNLTIIDGSAAVESGKVDAFLGSEPLTGLDVQAGKAKVLTSAAGYGMELGYLTASDSALANRAKKAAIADFVQRFYKAQAYLRAHPQLAAQTYVKTYGVPLAVAEDAVKSVQVKGTPITPAIISYQQEEADTLDSLGLIDKKVDVKQIFDLPFNTQIAKAAGLTS